MSGKSKAFGLLLVIISIAAFLKNFGIWNPFLIGNLPSSLAWIWNPLSYFTPQIVGNVPIISGSLGWVVNHVFAVIYSAVLFVIGAFALMK